jgi:gentisate 1,2-dioxygenase
MTPLPPALRGQSAITPSLHTGLQLILPGDFNITPSRTWHNHEDNGSAVSAEPVGWLDGLDIPMLCFGANMLPVRHEPPFGQASPIFSYPYERTREALHQLEKQAPIDA